MRRNQHANSGKGVTSKTTKGYMRATAGPLRGSYIHREVAAAMVGKELSKDIEVHHRDGNKLNFRFTNLFLLGSADHGWVSAKHAYFMREKDAKEKREFDSFMEEQAAKQWCEISAAKASGETYSVQDGKLRENWEERVGN